MSDERRSKSLPTLLGALVVLGLVLVVFGRSVTFEFLGYDDRYHIHDNAALHEAGAARFTHFWAHPYGNLYVPLAYNLFAVEAAATDRGTDAPLNARFEPRVFHGVNVALHAACCVLVFGIALRLGLGVVGAAFAGALFAIHPLQVESVAWISEQRGLLSASLALGAALVYFSGRDAATDRTHRGAYIGAAALFAISMLAKPSSAPLPVALIIVDVLVLKRDWRRSAMQLVPWCIGALALLVLTRVLQSAEAIRHVAPLWQRPLIAGDAGAFYLWKLVWPFALSPDHGRMPQWVAGSWWMYVAWIVPAALVIGSAAIRQWKLFAAALCFFALMAPTLGLVTFHHQSISTVADRYAYLSMAAMAMVFGALIGRAKSNWVFGAGTLLIAALGVRSIDQLKHWKSDESLWTHTIRVQPRSALAHNNLGYALYQQGEVVAALEHYLAAIEIDGGLAQVRTNAGAALEDLGRDAEAESMYRVAIEQYESDVRAIVNLGAILARRGELEEAKDLFGRALEIAPDDPDALSNLGMIRLTQGDLAEAQRLFERAIEENPRIAEAWHNLGIVCEQQGDAQGAVACWERAVECAPTLVESRYRLGNAMLASGDLDGAEAQLGEVIRLQPCNARALSNLGLVYVQKSELERAEAAFVRAVECDPQLREARENLENVRKLKARVIGEQK